MGYQVDSVCYSTELQALSASASSQVGAVVPHGGKSYVTGVSSVSASSITYSFTSLDGLDSFVLVAPMTPQPCGLLDWQDGLTIGWGIATAWIVTVAVMFLRKGVHL